MTARLDGKVAIVSGAARGIGAAIAELFAAEGAAVLVTDINDADGRQIVSGITAHGGRAAYQRVDVRSAADWHTAVLTAEREFGPVNLLVSNAFIISQPALADLSVEEWRASLDVNLTGAFHGLQAVLPGMRDRRQGSIVIISATNGNETALPAQAAYQAAKAALSSLARHVAVTYGHDGIRANAVHPGGTRTPMLAEEGILDMAQSLSVVFPISRLGEPVEIAHAALYLASDESSYTTGTSLVVDGGSSVGISPPEHPNA